MTEPQPRQRCASCPVASCDRLGEVHRDGRTHCETYLAARAVAQAYRAVREPNGRSAIEADPDWIARREAFRADQAARRAVRDCLHRKPLAEHERVHGCGCSSRCLLGKGSAAPGIPRFDECMACVKAQEPTS